MLYHVPASVLALIVFVLILLSNWIGYRFKQNQLLRKSSDELDDQGTIQSSLLGLMALLLAFSFSAVAIKFETGRALIVDEANDIGTAILRCDLYPDSVRNILRADFKEYVETRIDYYDAGQDDAKIKDAMQRGNDYSAKIWKLVMREAQNPANLVRSNMMVPAMNNMIDIVSTREAARTGKVPVVIIVMLFVLMISSGFLVGYGQKSKNRNQVMTVGFALMTTLAFYLVIELDRPRRGIINLDGTEQQIVNLRESFK